MKFPRVPRASDPWTGPRRRRGLRTALREFYARCDEVAVDLFRAIASVCCMEEVETARVVERVRTETAESVAAEGHADESVRTTPLV